MEATETILAQLSQLYDRAVATLRADIAAYANHGTLPPPERRTDGSYCYPELHVRLDAEPNHESTGRAFGRLTQRGDYSCTVTRPALFDDYLKEQIDLIREGFEVEVSGERRQPPEDDTLGFGQHLMRPVHGCFEGLLATHRFS